MRAGAQTVIEEAEYWTVCFFFFLSPTIRTAPTSADKASELADARATLSSGDSLSLSFCPSVYGDRAAERGYDAIWHACSPRSVSSHSSLAKGPLALIIYVAGNFLQKVGPFFFLPRFLNNLTPANCNPSIQSQYFWGCNLGDGALAGRALLFELFCRGATLPVFLNRWTLRTYIYFSSRCCDQSWSLVTSTVCESFQNW